MNNPSANDEKMWLLQVAEGNEKAFRILFDLHHHLLGAHIFRLTKSEELAEEIVQDVFIKIWMNRAALCDVQNFQAYLYVVSKNHALNYLKKLAHERTRTTALDLVEYQIYDDSSEVSEHDLLIEEAIDHLPPQQQKVYLMSRHGRLKQAQIADELNLSKGTVKKYVALASESVSNYIRKKLVSSSLAVLLYFL